MEIEEVIEFLSQVPPFQFLDEDELRRVASSVTMEFYPRGFTILLQDGAPSEYFNVIKKGGVKVYMKTGDEEEVVVDYRGEGDAFGFLSIVGGDKSRANVRAIEDTVCYLINRDTVMDLMDRNPAFTEFFLKSFLNKYIDRTYKEMHNKSLLYGSGDRMLFSTPVGELAVRDVVTASQEMTIRDAAALMSSCRISCLVLVEEDNVPVGIVTDRDFRDKVVSKGLDVLEPVKCIMSVSLIKVETKDYCFEAVLKMIRYNIHHLLVVDRGRLKGVITNHDFMMLQGASPVSVAREIENQYSVEGLVPVANRINGVITVLLKEGARASNITRIITEINDGLVRRILQIAEKKFGSPPVRYCWIVFGADGRKEQTIRTDQDNGIIYEDPRSPDEGRKAAQYFEGFSIFVRDTLVRCGFPPCAENHMASNPAWRQPLGAWKEYFSRWILSPTLENVLFSAVVFDFRPVFGEVHLAEKLRAYLLQTVNNHELFLKQMAEMTLRLRPPLGFFKTFIVEKGGAHKDQFDLKFRCIMLLIDMVRLFSLEKGITETSTLGRIAALKGSHETISEVGDELAQAFEFLMLLRIQHHFDQIEAGREIDNFVNPYNLTNLEKKTLKESCLLISRVQDMISREYRPGTVV